MKQVKYFLFLFLAALFVFVPGGVLAQEVEGEENQVEEVSEVSSFELFWPIAAGKTMGDPLFGVKRLKETGRGWLIFGKPQKADYEVFLAVKRTVEAEKLLNEGKSDLAGKTLERARVRVRSAHTNVEASDNLGSVVNQMNTRLDNMEIFLNWLSGRHEGESEKIDLLLEEVKSLNSGV